MVGDKCVDLWFGFDVDGELYFVFKVNGKIWKVMGVRMVDELVLLFVLLVFVLNFVVYYDFDYLDVVKLIVEVD